MSRDEMTCIICDHKFEHGTYSANINCPNCGQIYDYDEGQCIRLSEEQINILKAHKKGK